MTITSEISLSERIGLATSAAELQSLLTEIEQQEAERADLAAEIAESTADETDDEPAGVSERNRSTAARMREVTEASQEIGPLPSVADPKRRESCRLDLKRFASTYFAASCWRGFAPYQAEMLAAFQDVVLRGGKKCRAVRRGGLKSTLARIATAWAVFYGHRRFPVLIGATDDKSNEHRDNFLDMLRASEEFKADFPEVTPLLLKRSNPKKMLRLGGDLLVVTAKDERGVIVLPRIDGTPCSESRIAPYSVSSTDVSGLSFVNSTGSVVRPDLLIFDDVQTPQSASSFMATSKREDTICTTFMGLAGLGETIAAIMVCTVREENDLTMRFCDRMAHPDWDGQTFPILLKEPDSVEAKEHWANYGQKLREGATPDEGFALASAYYAEHRVVMDAGGEVAWEEDKEEGYASALQWAMTMSILQPDYFRCELQQKGARPKGSTIQLDPQELITRLSGVPRGTVPALATYLTCHVDSSDHVLWWVVCAFKPDLTSWIVDFGTWPDQGRQQFYKSDLRRMLEHELPGASWEEAFVNAHNILEEFILGREWPVEGGGSRLVDLLLKDWSDGSHKPRIESQVMASKHRSRIRPAKGFAPKPGKKRVHDYGDKLKDRDTGSDWVERRTDQPIHVQFDTNVFKSNCCRRLRTVVGAASAMLLPGSEESDLMLLAEHLTAEQAKPIIYDGSPGTVYEQIPGRDNDWFDNVVGCCVAASVLGCALPGEKSVSKALPAFVIPEHRIGKRQREFSGAQNDG